jgi:hypothetical protein
LPSQLFEVGIYIDAIDIAHNIINSMSNDEIKLSLSLYLLFKQRYIASFFDNRILRLWGCVQRYLLPQDQVIIILLQSQLWFILHGPSWKSIGSPSGTPSGNPSGAPSGLPSGLPSESPSGTTSGSPSNLPSATPNNKGYLVYASSIVSIAES